jgi:hypothetical protein
MSLATFNAQTASGEGAHGPDRSKLAKWNHCRTNRRHRQSARIADQWLGARQVSVLALDGAKIMTPNGPW